MQVIVLVAILFIFVMSVILHEVAHGYVARLCGDYTAEAQGRLTLNPIAHIDPVFTILVPLIFYFVTQGAFIFGGAKPVPINIYNFRHLKRDYLYVSAAGVATNLAIAVVLAGMLHVGLRLPLNVEGSVAEAILAGGIFFNLLLALFNLIPIPPLDGSRILRSLLPDPLINVFDRLDRFGIALVFLFVWLFMGLVLRGILLSFGLLGFSYVEVARFLREIRQAMGR